jgi:hypothetical protein
MKNKIRTASHWYSPTIMENGDDSGAGSGLWLVACYPGGGGALGLWPARTLISMKKLDEAPVRSGAEKSLALGLNSRELVDEFPRGERARGAHVGEGPAAHAWGRSWRPRRRGRGGALQGAALGASSRWRVVPQVGGKGGLQEVVLESSLRCRSWALEASRVSRRRRGLWMGLAGALDEVELADGGESGRGWPALWREWSWSAVGLVSRG